MSSSHTHTIVHVCAYVSDLLCIDILVFCLLIYVTSVLELLLTHPILEDCVYTAGGSRIQPPVPLPVNH